MSFFIFVQVFTRRWILDSRCFGSHFESCISVGCEVGIFLDILSIYISYSKIDFLKWDISVFGDFQVSCFFVFFFCESGSRENTTMATPDTVELFFWWLWFGWNCRLFFLLFFLLHNLLYLWGSIILNVLWYSMFLFLLKIRTNFVNTNCYF